MGSIGLNGSFLLAAEKEVDFMIHGLIKYHLFGQELWITTTHVSVLIVMAVLLVFAIAANRTMKRAAEVPGGFQNVVELVVKICRQICELYQRAVFVYFCQQHIGSFRSETADCGLRCDAAAWFDHVWYYPVQ